ncbi:MAG: DUF1778 domain-containing protein [Geminicoccaceae bacterium]
MGVAAGKSERVNLRIDVESKQALERAAAYAGSSLSDFVITRALAAAHEVIRSQETVTLSRRDWDAFLDAIENPPEPNENLKRAVRRHDELYGR